MSEETYDKWFEKATGLDPFPFQKRFAETQDLIQLVNVPTGLGKTAMVIVGWLWRRFAAGEKYKSATPRRLVYCLPMRVLVEQSAKLASLWIKSLKAQNHLGKDAPLVHILMGGEDEVGWDIHLEREAIIIGTQDMLLSRALNRGYAASRSRWPMQFGLLHNDCLWVFDEIQLMGSGLATTTQMEAFRHILGAKDGNGCHSVWMSATLRPGWLKTVDFKDRIDGQGRIDGKRTLLLTDEDHKNQDVENRWNANKPLAKSASALDKPKDLADEIRKAHKPGTRTIVVVNTVRRACALSEALKKIAGGGPGEGAKKVSRRKSAAVSAAEVADAPPGPKVVLLHSRFRPSDRRRRVDDVLAEPPQAGTIVVSTQVIEAGVDVSAATLFSELAPWASLVQRFGRCNRRGDQNEHTSVRWIDVSGQKAEEAAKPYRLDDLQSARKHLERLETVGPSSLHDYVKALPEQETASLFALEHGHVIRRKDLLDLFDTTPDLAGNDIDIDRFVREVEDSDVHVFWRAWDQPHGGEPPHEEEPAPRRDELCPAPIGEFKRFAADRRGQVWRWNFLDGKWEAADVNYIAPGQVYLVHVEAGGYSEELGWDLNEEDSVNPIASANGNPSDGTADDLLSRIGVWQTIAEHAEEVCFELDQILKALPAENPEIEALRHAARWHDRGKAHVVFQKALPEGVPDPAKVWAKAAGSWKRYDRRHFRHELASALAVLMSPNNMIPAEYRDLVAYLVAAHHGKVRLSIRSLPNETRPPMENGKSRRFARGVWEGDQLLETDLGRGIISPAVQLSLEPMEIGLCERPPFQDQPSWADRTIRLRDRLGPFRLAYLEAIMRSADWRASRNAEQRKAGGEHTAVEAGRA